MLLLFFNPQGAGSAIAGFDLTQTAKALLSRLGAVSWSDLDWLTEAEVFSYFDEAAKRLASLTGAFVERDTSESLASAQTEYACALGWISTIHLSNNGARLRPTSVAELLALDSTWPETPGNPSRYSDDAGPLGTFVVYPQPQTAQAGQALAQIYHRFPLDLSSSQTLTPVPSPVADYFLYFALMRARGKQSESAMPEVAAHAEERCKMYESIFANYYSEGLAE